jgi:L-arabinose isomerase
MIDLKNYEVWFATGSQHLCGPKTLQQVAEDSQAIADGLNRSSNVPVKIFLNLCSQIRTQFKHFASKQTVIIIVSDL